MKNPIFIKWDEDIIISKETKGSNNKFISNKYLYIPSYKKNPPKAKNNTLYKKIIF